MKIVFLIFAFLVALSACNSSTPKEEKPKAFFTSNEIGWHIEIPEGFKTLSQSRIKANTEKGKEAIGETVGEEVATSGLKTLVNFQKNQFNSLNATIEPYLESEKGAYEKNHAQLKKLIFDTYTNQHIKVDTSSAIEMIQKKKFLVFYVKIYGPDQVVVLNQATYSTLTNGYDFGVNINYNNEKDKNLLIDAFKKSRLTMY